MTPLPTRLRARVAELDAWLREAGDVRTTPWRLEPDGRLRCEIRDAEGRRYLTSAEAT